MYYDYVQISKINDFVFCPFSLYFHSIYESFESGRYKAAPQLAGKLAHKPIEGNKYSTSLRYLQGAEVFSEKYGLIGKIDIYDRQTKTLIERKKKIKKIYDGYIYQLFAQKLCLEEMGYKVRKMELYSMDDNRKYPIKISWRQKKKFFQVIKNIKNFDLSCRKTINRSKCVNCIYRELCQNDI